MPTSNPPGGDETTVKELLTRVKDLSLEDFRNLWGDVFLVQTGKASDMKPPDRPWRATMAGKMSFSDESTGSLNNKSLVYPVRNTERTLTTRFVSIGRNAGTNDITASVDLYGGPRIQGPIVDIGSFEVPPPGTAIIIK